MLPYQVTVYRRKEGFTLIEIIVFIVIIAILAAAVLPSVLKDEIMNRSAKETAGTIDYLSVSSINFFRSSRELVGTERWPNDISEMQTYDVIPPTWVNSNPWGNPYTITNNGNYATISTVVPSSVSNIIKGRLKLANVVSSGDFSTVSTSVPKPWTEIVRLNPCLMSGGLDYGNADFVAADDSWISGLHKNINRFVVSGGYNVYVTPYDGTENRGWLVICAKEIIINVQLRVARNGWGGGGGAGGGVGGYNSCGAYTGGVGGTGLAGGINGSNGAPCSGLNGSLGGSGGTGGGPGGGLGGNGGSGGIFSGGQGGNGANGGQGGYASPGINGDSSTDESLLMGGGGGGGGSGGGGGAYDGGASYGGYGGGGGAGNVGGGYIKLYASISINIQATVSTWGNRGCSGDAQGKNGGNAASSCASGNAWGDSGSVYGGDGGNGGGGGAGGILLKSPLINITGTLNALSSDTVDRGNGGTIKIFYQGVAPGGTKYYGRLYETTY